MADQCRHEFRDSDHCALCGKSFARLLLEERKEWVATMRQLRSELDEAISGRAAWARQCNLASEHQADTANKLAVAEAKLAAALAKAECWTEIPGGVQACGEELLALLRPTDDEGGGT